MKWELNDMKNKYDKVKYVAFLSLNSLFFNHLSYL